MMPIGMRIWIILAALAAFWLAAEMRCCDLPVAVAVFTAIGYAIGGDK